MLSSLELVMKWKALALAVSSILVAFLGIVGTQTLVIRHLVILQSLWVASPYLALAIIAFFSRKRVSTASLTFFATLFLAICGRFAVKMAVSWVWAVQFVPLFLWGGCAVLLLLQLWRRWLDNRSARPAP
jgi:hypothetical protein